MRKARTEQLKYEARRPLTIISYFGREVSIFLATLLAVAGAFFPVVLLLAAVLFAAVPLFEAEALLLEAVEPLRRPLSVAFL